MDKPFKTIEEQVGILSSRGVEVDDETASVLEREGYYSVVNGYKDIFIDDEATTEARDDRFAEGTSFSDIYRLFRFDRELRTTMMGYFSQAEAALKTACAYQFSEAHQGDLEAYLRRSSYRDEPRYDGRVGRLIGEFKKILHKHPYEREPFKRDYIEHYVLHHDEVPLWVLTNYLMLGQAFKFYEFQPEWLRNRIARSFSGLYAETHDGGKRISHRRLRLAYDHIKDFRNICAHDERLYCAKVSPSKDIRFADMMLDLEIVLTKEEYARMRQDVLNLVFGVMRDIDVEHAAKVVVAMGITDINALVIP